MASKNELYKPTKNLILSFINQNKQSFKEHTESKKKSVIDSEDITLEKLHYLKLIALSEHSDTGLIKYINEILDENQ